MTQVEAVSKQELIESLTRSEKIYSFCEAKYKIKFNGEESKIGGHMHLRMYRDSLIWLRFRKLTVEGARALVSKDTTQILYRLDDLYEVGSTVDVLERLQIDFSYHELQDLIIGQVSVPTVDEVHYRSDTYHYLHFEDAGTYYTYQFDLQLRLIGIEIKDAFERELIIRYEDYDEEYNRFNKRKISISTPSEGLSEISIKLSSIIFDHPKSLPFEIPAHYTRL